MKTKRQHLAEYVVFSWSLCLGPIASYAQSSPITAPDPNTVQVLAIEGSAEGVQFRVSGADPDRWDRAYVNQVLRAGDFFKTGPRSRAVLRFSNRETFQVRENSTIGILQETKPDRGIEFLRGFFYFFHRDKPGTFKSRTPLVNAVVKGTEFVVEVRDNGITLFHLLDGSLELSNAFGHLSLLSGQSSVTRPGQAPLPTSPTEAMPITQWCLYYPGILNLRELGLNLDVTSILEASLQAFQAGNLPDALALYPPERIPESSGEKIYFANLLLSVGEAEMAKSRLDTLALEEPEASYLLPLSQALRTVIAAVQLQSRPVEMASDLATVHLANSFAFQAQFDLERALEAALRSAEIDPGFAFAWARVAELEFSFGNTKKALRALEKSLSLAPGNAQAVALKGFLMAAHNRMVQAEMLFDQAIDLNGSLGNAWLGRGLSKIRQGQTESGLRDLQVAATVEPQRSMLRSYLGKAFSTLGNNTLASQELLLAQKLDPADPTPWLYAALVLNQENRVNEAVRHLEVSRGLSDNRRAFRSRLQLDKDRALRSANLARIYREAGMIDWSVYEAARGVSDDYASYSAHLFLAHSYDSLRDPWQVNLRYETAWLAEYLLANLLAPVGAGLFTPAISQQEYSKMFEQDRFGLASSTEYFSQGGWVQSGSQYAVLGDFGYSLDLFYRSLDLRRSNSDLENLTLTGRLKQQITPQDSLYIQTSYYDAQSGDVARRYDPANANRGLQVDERQQPTLLAGFHHEWSPGSHSLLLGSWLHDNLEVRNPNAQTILVEPGGVTYVTPVVRDQQYQSEFNAFSLEGQQIWQTADHTLVAGTRAQAGKFRTWSRLNEDLSTSQPMLNQRAESDFLRANAYIHYDWQITPSLKLMAGLSYDYLRYPENHRYPPISDKEKEVDHVSPKGGFIWTPSPSTTIRGAYAQALGGVSFDQSFRLEPTQVAGFNQAYRSILPESIAGASAGEEFEISGLAMEQKFFQGTYLALVAERLASEVRREEGVVVFDPGMFPSLSFGHGTTPDELTFEEYSLTLTLNQLVGNYWSFGSRYRLSHAELDQHYPELRGGINGYTGQPTQTKTSHRSWLHQANLYLIFNHPRGFFAQGEAVWIQQSNSGYMPALSGDHLWHFNCLVGYRFPRHRAEFRLGLLNVTDRDYRLNPLNATAYFWPERTLTASMHFNF